MFSEQEHHGEVEEWFDPDYPAADGRTPVEGLYVAAPNGDRNAQAVVAAGQGAHVARSLVEDRRRERGLDGEVAALYDWLRSESEFSGPWADRERWHEYFDTEMAETDLPAARHDALRQAYVDEAFDTRVADDAVEERAACGLERFAEVVGEERLVAAIGKERLIEAVGEARLAEAVGVERLLETMGIERAVDAVGRERLRDVLDDDGRGDSSAPASPDSASHEEGE